MNITSKQEYDSAKQCLVEALGLTSNFIPQSVFELVESDPMYLHHLMISKDHPEFLSILFHEAELKRGTVKSSIQLLSNFVRSMKDWAASGFEYASNEEVDQRLAICRKCPNLGRKPNDLMVYRLIRPPEICKICGCDIMFKARIKKSTCPDKNYGPYGRWNSRNDWSCVNPR